MIEYVAIILIVMIAIITIVGLLCDFRNIKLQNQNVEKLEEEVYKYLRHDAQDTYKVTYKVEEASKEPRVLDDKETIRILNGYIKNLEKQLEEANENLELMQEQITGDTTELEYDHDIKILEEQLKQANERIEYLQKQINKNKNKTKIIYG